MKASRNKAAKLQYCNTADSQSNYNFICQPHDFFEEYSRLETESNYFRGSPRVQQKQETKLCREVRAALESSKSDSSLVIFDAKQQTGPKPSSRARWAKPIKTYRERSYKEGQLTFEEPYSCSSNRHKAYPPLTKASTKGSQNASTCMLT